MSKQEGDAVRLPPTDQEPDVEAHRKRFHRGDAEAPADQGERSEEESEDPDVEGHGFRLPPKASADGGERSEESEDPDVEAPTDAGERERKG